MLRTNLFLLILLFCIQLTGYSISPALADEVHPASITDATGEIDTDNENFQNSESTGDFPGRDDPVISVEPIEIISELLTGEDQGYVVTIFNEGDEDLVYNTEIAIIDEPDFRVVRGPRRDEPNSRFAFFQDGPAWGGDIGNLVLDQVEGLEYDRFPSDEFGDFPIEDYGVLWICHSEQRDPFNTAYNNNRERIEEWVDRGGSFYASTGTNQYNVVPIHPGGLTYTRGGTSNGTVQVSNDPGDENYNYLAELMNWEEDRTVLRGSALFHVHYEQAEINEIDNSDWNQTIVSLEGQETPGILAYQYGSGHCVVGGTTDGHQHNNFNNPPDWGSAGEELCYYLDFLANVSQWIAVDPANGEIEPDQMVDMIVTLDATGLIGGEYEGEVRIQSNDRDNPEVVVSIFLEVTGAPDIDVQWDRDFGYPDIVDWDLAYLDLFVGNPYEVIVYIVNIGTDILNVEAIDFQGGGAEFFSADRVEDFEALDPNDEIEIILTLNADEAGDYEVVMVVTSDDPDQEDYEVFLHGSPGSPPNINVEPDAIEDELLGAESHEHIANVENNGESELRFEVDVEIVAEPDNDRAFRSVRTNRRLSGPNRDDPGDLISEFAAPNGGVNQYNAGLAWDEDNGYMWITQWNNPFRCVAINPSDDFEVAGQFNAPGGCMGADYYQGTIYIVNWANRFLFRFDTEGQNLGNMNVPVQPTAITINQEEGWLILEDAGGNRDLIVYDLENGLEVLGRINNYRNFLQNNNTRSLEWVEAHPDGQLWVNTRRNNGGNMAWQIAVDEDDFIATELVQNFVTFPAGSGQEWDGLGHDGENLWASSFGNNSIRIIDDGTTELKWISVDPTEGELEGGADVDLVVTLDGTKLFGGVYEAEVQIFSNDPDDPQVDVFVSLTIEPAPDIFVEWPDEAGFEEENPLIDWNQYHPDIFTGEVYDIPVTIINDGTDVLVVNDITSNDEHFTADPTNFEVEFENEAIVNFTFTVDDPGEWDAIMTIESSDPYKEIIEIDLRAAAFDPPIIEVDIIEIENDLISGENSEHVVNISNTGDAELRWETELEIIEGNVRDNRRQRNVRKVGPVAERVYTSEQFNRADDPGWNSRSISGINQNEVEDLYEASPRRDEPSGRGILIAERCGWNNWDFEQYFRNIDGFEYDRFRTWNDVADVNFTDYDIMWLGNYETEAWVANYNRNLERIEEFVERGGALYHTSGTNFHNTRPVNPGGLVYSGSASQNDCPIVLDPEDNFLINYMNENDPFDWEWGVGQRLHGSGNAHGTFLERQLDDIDNSDWFEIMAVGNPIDEPILVTYQFGQGFCFVGTILDGYLHARPAEFQWGRTGEAVIWYLDYLSTFSRWVTWDPADGSLESGADVDLVIGLDATGLYTGFYEADLHILSNDPADPDVVVSITLDVTGFPLADITWPESWGYPDIAVWNEFYEELYAGGPYTLPFNFKNIGTDDLTILSVESNNEVFTTDWDPETQAVIPAGEQTVVNVTFESDEDNIYDAFVTATYDDDVEPIQIWVSAESFAPPILIVEPERIEVELFTGQMREFILDLINDGEADLRWWSDKTIIEEPEDQRDRSSRHVRSTSDVVGPMRDDLGDPLGIYGWNNAPANRYKSAAFDYDNEWMWLATYSPNFIKAISFDENYEDFNNEVNDFQPGGNPMDIAWLDGRLFVIPWANQFLLRYDAEGNDLGNINFDFRPCGVGASMEMNLLFVQEDNPDNNRNIHVFQMNDDGQAEEQIGLINNYRPMMNNQWCRNVEWVDDHPEGPLWVHTSGGQLHQFSIDTNEWQAIERVQVLQNFGGNQEYDGVAHDRNNLWHGAWNANEYVIIDDGIAEVRWLTWIERDGIIESGESEDVIVTISSDGLIAGDYIADLNIYSNDPDFPDDVPDVAVRVELTVVGIPNIMVMPGGEGFDPLDFGRVYFGYPTSRVVTIYNDGTDDLEIMEVFSEDNPDCYVEEADIADLIVRPGDEVPLNIWYNADPERPGEQEATLRFMSNDENWEEGYPVEVVVSEGAMEHPTLELEPLQFEFALNEGEEDEDLLRASNTGGSTLWFSTDIETVREPGDERDNELNRSIRSTLRSVGPRRDVPEGRFGLFQDTETFGWVNQHLFSRIDDLDYVWFREADDLLDADLNDFDALWVETGNQSDDFQRIWDNNLERFEDYVSRGRSMFIEQGHNDGNDVTHTTPGGLDFVWNPDEGTLAVGPEDNWLVEQMGWEIGQPFQGGSFTHVIYPFEALENIENSNWYQVIAVGQENELPAIVHYNFGQGNVIVSGSPCGHQWRFHNQDGRWGSCGETLLEYLVLNSTTGWITVDPSDGEIEEGDELDIIITVSTEGLIGGDYEGAIHFLSNDPENPDQVVTVLLNVTGISMIDGDPIPFPFDGAEALEYEGVYYVDQEYVMNIEIINTGSESFEIQDIDVSDGNNWDFRVPQMNVPARSSITAELVFAPSEVGDFEVIVMLATDAPNVDNGEVWWEASGSAVLPPIIILDVPGNNDEAIEVSMMLDDEPEEMLMMIAAEDGDRDDLHFSISSELIEEERDSQGRVMRSIEDQSGPVRDDPGDILGQVDVPFNNTSGMAFDGELLWGCSYGNDRLGAINVNDMEVVQNILIHDQPLSMTFDGENLWIGRWSTETVYIYDLEGELVEQFNLQFRQMAGMGSDREEFVYINSLDDRNIHVVSIEEREQVGVINFRAAMENAEVWGIDWVPEHSDGQLWGNAPNRMYQAFVDEEGNVEAIQNFATNADQPYVGPGHDGENIWHGMWNQQLWIMRDDGVDEGLFWLTIDPEEGELEPGADIDIFLSFSTEDLEDETLYEGIMIIESNDPVNPEIVINVSLQTGVPGLQHFRDFEITDVSHSVLITELNIDDNPVPTGWEVGVFTPGGELSGGSVWIEERQLGLAVWGNDDNDQFNAGEVMSYRVWDPENRVEYTPRVELDEGHIIWIPNGFTALSLWASTERELSIELIEGWNTISINVYPLNYYLEGEHRGASIPLMFDDLRDDEDNHIVLLVKDEQGRFWTPAWNFLNIPFWDVMDGYKVKVSEDVNFTIEGAPIAASASIFMNSGWNLMAYFPTYDLDASAPDYYVLTDIIEHVILAKDNWGRFMSPGFNFSNMNPWTEGQGYQVKISSEVEIVHHYPAPQEEEELAAHGIQVNNLEIGVDPTGSNMSILVNSIAGDKVSDGDKILAYDPSGELAGSGTVSDNRCGLAVWGDDQSTEDIDGMQRHQAFDLRLLDVETETEFLIDITSVQKGSMEYRTDNFTVVDAELKPILPDNYFLSGAYPNPFNNQTRLSYGMPESGVVKIKVFDISGRLVETLVNGEIQAGYHDVIWKAAGVSTGIYLIEMNADKFNSVKKVMLVR